MPQAGLQAAGSFRGREGHDEAVTFTLALRRSVLDIVAAQILAGYLSSRLGTRRPDCSA